MLASSSAGNSTFIATSRTRILIDAGLTRKEIVARLGAIGEDATKLDAVFITHEHSDHIAGLPVLAKHVGMPIFLTHLTRPGIDFNGGLPNVQEFQAGSCIDFQDLCVQSFTIPHDAADPVGYTVTAEGIKIAIATDLGYVPENVKFHLKDSHFLLLESNHCPEMLKVGPYPLHLKHRILSRRGHLSNEAACEYIEQELTSQVQTLVLGHLSEQNNTIWQAEIMAQQALERRHLSPNLVIAEPRRQLELFHL